MLGCGSKSDAEGMLAQRKWHVICYELLLKIMVTADCIRAPGAIFSSRTVSVLLKTGSVFSFYICIYLSRMFKLLQVQFYNATVVISGHKT